MSKSEKNKRYHYSSWNFISKLNLIYEIPIFQNANKLLKSFPPKILKVREVCDIGRAEQVDYLTTRLEKEYERREKLSPNNVSNVFWSLYTLFKSYFWNIYFLQIGYVLSKKFYALFLFNILESITNNDMRRLFLWAIGLFSSLFFGFYFSTHAGNFNTNGGQLIKSSLTGMIYKKLMRVSLYNVNKISIGKIINILANDMNVFQVETYFAVMALTTPVSIICFIAILYNYIGAYCFLGAGVMMFSIPISVFLNNLAESYRKQKNLLTDQRVKLTNTVIDGIRILKMYIWDLKFKHSIEEAREKEIKVIIPIIILELILRSIAIDFYLIGAIVTFFTYGMIEGVHMMPSQIFATIYMLGLLRVTLLMSLALGLKTISEIKLLFERVHQIMQTCEKDFKAIVGPIDKENAIEFENFYGTWEDNVIEEIPMEAESEDSERIDTNRNNEAKMLNYEGSQVNREVKYVLKNINLEIAKGTFNVIIGRVNTGKTSLLNAFFNELPFTKGALRYSENLAFVEQEPIIFSRSVKENIIHGKEIDQVKLDKIIECTCLTEDLKIFPDGMETQIGEKGINLSGGQKARISLARALYSDASIYLLDDPFSAVDSKVSMKIFENVIKGYLHGKTIILATHHLHFTKLADKVIVLEEGEILVQGTYEEIVINKREALHYLTQNNRGMSPMNSPSRASKRSAENDKNDEDSEEEALFLEEKNLFSKEDPNDGRVTMKTYKEYFSYFRPRFYFAIVISFYLLSRIKDVGVPRLMGLWGNGDITLTYAFSISLILFGIGYLLTIIQVFFYTKIALKAAQQIHDLMISNIICSKSVFFDRNPIGRILNRFTNDVGNLDKYIVSLLADLIQGLTFFFSLFIGVWTIEPLYIVLNVIHLGGIFLILKYTKGAIIQTKMLELTTRSPIYSHISLSLQGLLAVRVYNQEVNFKEYLFKAIDENVWAHIHYWNTTRFMSFLVEYLNSIVEISAFLLIVLYNDQNAGAKGYALFLIAGISGYIQFVLRQGFLFAVLMSSTARCIAYTKLEGESSLRVIERERKLNPGWPMSGKIQFTNVSMRYREDLDFVIKGISFTIESGEKVACVGRTGSGKSSLIQILFRMVEIDEGQVSLDGVNIKSIGLHCLRKNIGIIPQTPFIFSGSVRKNIDPFDNFTDDEVWDALKDVELDECVREFPEGLQSEIGVSNVSFSSGQKQLLCLCRAILMKFKVLILDEATSNVDFETDRMIQDVIRNKFENSTIFCIAHRITTIADYEKVLVISDGNIVEMGSPYELLVKNIGDSKITNVNGHFAALVKDTGVRTASHIITIAKESYEMRNYD